MSDPSPSWLNVVEQLSTISPCISDPVCWEDRLDAKDFVARFLPTLKPREERILRLRYGLGISGEHSRSEVADAFGVTPSRIDQIERKAMRKLRLRASRVYPGRSFEPGVAVQPGTFSDKPGGCATSKPVACSTRTLKQRSSIGARSRPTSEPKQRGAQRTDRRATREFNETMSNDEYYADVRRTALYYEWLRERDAARATSRPDPNPSYSFRSLSINVQSKPSNVEARGHSSDAKPKSPYSVDNRPVDSATYGLVAAIAFAIIVVAAFGCWWQTLGHEGKILYQATFGGSGQLIRLLVYIITPMIFILSGFVAFDKLTEWHHRPKRRAE